MEFIDRILPADEEAPREQHTAHRIWQRIRQEQPRSMAGKRRCGVTYISAGDSRLSSTLT
jgi:hypothetical protein